MPEYGRFRVPGGTYCFTPNALERRTDMRMRPIEALRGLCGGLGRNGLFTSMLGWVCRITSMAYSRWREDDFSNRMKAIKIRFVPAVEPNERRAAVRVAHCERGISKRNRFIFCSLWVNGFFDSLVSWQMETR